MQAPRDFSDPGTPLVWSPSSLAARARCPAAWAYRYQDRLKPVGDDGRFDVGTLTAKVLELVVQRRFVGKHLPGADADAVASCAEVAWEVDPPAREKARAKVAAEVGRCAAALLQALLAHFDGCRVVAVEHELKVGLGRPQLSLMGRPDIILEAPSGALVVPDYKTSTQDTRAKRYALDVQAHGYALALWLMNPTVLRQALGVQGPCERAPVKTCQIKVKRASGKVVIVDTTPGGPDGKDQRQALANFQRWIWDQTALVRKGVHLPTYASHGSACYGCAYREVCEAQLNGDAKEEARARGEFGPVPDLIDNP